MRKSTDFKNKEVINIRDGRRLGYVCDVEIDIMEGILKSIILPGSGSGKWLPWGPQPKDIVIAWNQIKIIGDDLILVDIDSPVSE